MIADGHGPRGPSAETRDTSHARSNTQVLTPHRLTTTAVAGRKNRTPRLPEQFSSKCSNGEANRKVTCFSALLNKKILPRFARTSIKKHKRCQRNNGALIFKTLLLTQMENCCALTAPLKAAEIADLENVQRSLSVIAAYVQLARGTKYSQFPRWLDRWLKARKHLGLLMLFNAVIHVLAMLARGELYSVSDGWRGPTYVACGIVAFTLAGVLGLASLPSVAASMTWREFSFLQSRVGWLTLLLATFHIIFMVWDGLVTPHFICFFPTIGQVVVVVPVHSLC
nr:metalloreductase STEAP1-like [Procambarus clarkii]